MSRIFVTRNCNLYSSPIIFGIIKSRVLTMGLNCGSDVGKKYIEDFGLEASVGRELVGWWAGLLAEAED
jgi:hypothetical protein